MSATASNQTSYIYLANPRGFCAGVDLAIDIVNRALDTFGAPIYVRHEVVHNRYVVDDLTQRGAVFVDELADVPENHIVIFSAHGVSKRVKEEAKRRQLQVFDATCPLVTKVHMEVMKLARDDRECVLIGHQNHPEVEGTMGQYVSERGGIYLVEHVDDVSQLIVKNPDTLAYVTQTTLSVDDTAVIIEALRARFPHITEPRKADICYATQNRQNAVKVLAQKCDVVVVVGSANSSNSNRLRELASRAGVDAYLVDQTEKLDVNWFKHKRYIGVTAGASAPEVLVQQVIARLQAIQPATVIELEGVQETITFSLPQGLRDKLNG